MYIELKNINKSFGDFQASKDVNFAIEKGKLVGLLGPSGSGKTTILRMLAGLEHQDSGDICINGNVVNDLPSSQRGIGFVFQNYALFPYLTVYDNIAYGLKIQKKDKKFIKQRVTELLDLVGLPGLEKRYPDQLSGGQRQRIALARALAPNPEVLLLDEPFAAIDAKVRQELRTWLRETIDKIGITSIFVAQFIGKSSIIEEYGKLKGFDSIGSDTRAIIRPEFVEIKSLKDVTEQSSIYEQAAVEQSIFRGNYFEVLLNIKGITIRTNSPLVNGPLKSGDKVWVVINQMYVFDDKTTTTLTNKGLDVSSMYYI